MDAVAAEARASKRTVYQFFADKEDLFGATVLDTVDRGYESFKPRAAYIFTWLIVSIPANTVAFHAAYTP